MTCPYCNKSIEAMTGLQEIIKFQRHLGSCKKNPKRKSYIGEDGKLFSSAQDTGLAEALEIRQ